MASRDSSMTICANSYKKSRINLKYCFLFIVLVIKKPANHGVIAG